MSLRQCGDLVISIVFALLLLRSEGASRTHCMQDSENAMVVQLCNG